MNDIRTFHGQKTFHTVYIKPCPHCRRKVRLSQKTARQRRESHFSATVRTGFNADAPVLRRPGPRARRKNCWIYGVGKVRRSTAIINGMKKSTNRNVLIYSCNHLLLTRHSSSASTSLASSASNYYTLPVWIDLMASHHDDDGQPCGRVLRLDITRRDSTRCAARLVSYLASAASASRSGHRSCDASSTLSSAAGMSSC